MAKRQSQGVSLCVVVLASFFICVAASFDVAQPAGEDFGAVPSSNDDEALSAPEVLGEGDATESLQAAADSLIDTPPHQGRHGRRLAQVLAESHGVKYTDANARRFFQDRTVRKKAKLATIKNAMIASKESGEPGWYRKAAYKKAWKKNTRKVYKSNTLFLKAMAHESNEAVADYPLGTWNDYYAKAKADKYTRAQQKSAKTLGNRFKQNKSKANHQNPWTAEDDMEEEERQIRVGMLNKEDSVYHRSFNFRGSKRLSGGSRGSRRLSGSSRGSKRLSGSGHMQISDY